MYASVGRVSSEVVLSTHRSTHKPRLRSSYGKALNSFYKPILIQLATIFFLKKNSSCWSLSSFPALYRIKSSPLTIAFNVSQMCYPTFSALFGATIYSSNNKNGLWHPLEIPCHSVSKPRFPLSLSFRFINLDLQILHSLSRYKKSKWVH